MITARVALQTLTSRLWFFVVFEQVGPAGEGLFTHKELGEGGPYGVWLYRCGEGCNYPFSFADMSITPRTLTTDSIVDGEPPLYPGTDEPYTNKVMAMNKDMIFSQLAASKAFDPEVKAFSVLWVSQSYYLWTGSSGWEAPFDFSTKAFFADRDNYLFITDDGENVVAHNFRNMGNFLWGAATYIMGVPQWLALTGAHLNNLDDTGSWDSDDDQWSIQLGRKYAKEMNWKTIYGGRATIFKN